MTLSIGRVLMGRKACYRIIEVLKPGAVFKATFEAINPKASPPHRFLAGTKDFVVIKTEPVEDMKFFYDQEYRAYGFPDIASSPYIRKLLDNVGHKQVPDAGRPELKPGTESISTIKSHTEPELQIMVRSEPVLEVQLKLKSEDLPGPVPETASEPVSGEVLGPMPKDPSPPKPGIQSEPQTRSDLKVGDSPQLKPKDSSELKSEVGLEPTPDSQFLSTPGIPVEHMSAVELKPTTTVESEPEPQVQPQLELEPDCMVFEWMDYDLRSVPAINHRSSSNLPRLIATAILGAIVDFNEGLKGVHTDINPNNILVSDPDGLSPVVKLGDFGCIVAEGLKKQARQGFAIRAPEVWRGMGCWQSSDVWSLGISLVHWMAEYPIFGPKDKIIDDLTEAWCIAKIMRLVGYSDLPVHEECGEDFVVAAYLETNSFVIPDTTIERPFITVGTLRQELEGLPGPKVDPGLIDFVEYLLVYDHTKRPSAKQALEHPYLEPQHRQRNPQTPKASIKSTES